MYDPEKLPEAPGFPRIRSGSRCAKRSTSADLPLIGVNVDRLVNHTLFKRGRIIFSFDR